MIRRWRPGALLLALLLLGGCATTPPPSLPAVDRDRQLTLWQSHRDALALWNSFQLEGRIAATGQPLSARLRWLQQADTQFDVHLSGPVGVGAIRLRGNPKVVEIQAKRERWVSTDPEADLTDLLGWSPPLAALPYWARGLPQPGVPVQFELDALGRIVRLEQEGWTMTVLGYGNERPALPTRVEWQREAQTITLINDRWRRTP